MNKIKTALISVSDKSGLVERGAKLNSFGIKILSTGGSANTLKEAGIDVIEVSDHTGFPEMLDGRVKTLNPIIHGGILAKRESDDHMRTLKDHNIETIDLVIINLYPFVKTIENPNSTYEDAIENIDIGGPAMIRSSAKNHQDVTIVTSPNDYQSLIDELNKNNGEVSFDLRKEFALKAFEHTSSYDQAIFQYLQSANNGGDKFPKNISIQLKDQINKLKSKS